MKTFEKAQVGDKVYSLRYGEGIIRRVGHVIEDYPLHINFTNNSTGAAFTIDGKFLKKEATPDLYWSKPEIIAPEAPKRLVDKVLTVYANVYPRHSFNSIRNHGDYSLGELYSDKQQCLSLNSGNTVFKAAEITIKFQIEE